MANNGGGAVAPEENCSPVRLPFMLNNSDFLDAMYNAFDPFEPLPAGDSAYVDCREVRGDEDIKKDLGNKIRRADRMTCQLYAGHRGAGKSTELLRLKQYLEEQNFWVVYFGADAEDIDPEETEYTDILLACTRHLLDSLKDSANPTPLLNWLASRWQELQDLALTEIAFDNLSLEAQLAQFAKITTNLRLDPTKRHQIREKVNPHTVTLIEALNEFIREAKQQLPQKRQQLAVIVDNLDRIVPVPQSSGQTNHEEIFVDRSAQLQALDCHLVYTIPISLAYSKRAADLRDIYGNLQVLPMIMVQTRDGNAYEPGINKVKEAIAKRVEPFVENRALAPNIFDSDDTIRRLCQMSGGHLRNLLLLVQQAVSHTDDLPISARSVQRSITQARDTYRRTVENEEWPILAEVSRSKQILNDDRYRNLAFRRCLLEYCDFDSQGEMQRWYDVHPLIQGITEFKEALGNNQP